MMRLRVLHRKVLPSTRCCVPSRSFVDSAKVFYDTNIELYANRELQPHSLRQMIEFGRRMDEKKIIQSAQYVQRDLPIQLARRLSELNVLPHIVVSNPYFNLVYNKYWNAFNRVRLVPPVKTLADDAKFTSLLKELVDDTVEVIDLLAKGTSEVSTRLSRQRLDLEMFLDTMLFSRISRRMLAEQHIALHEPPREGWVGVISVKCQLRSCIERAAADAGEKCEKLYGCSPKIRVHGNRDARLPHVPAQLEYVFCEVIKNAMKSTVDRHLLTHNEDGFREPPSVDIFIAQGPKRTTIRISDEGGGIGDDIARDVFRYGFTSVRTEDLGDGRELGLLGMDTDVLTSPLSGKGFGLPLARTYLRYFGGDLQLMSLDGCGTDAYIRLDNTGDHIPKHAIVVGHTDFRPVA